MWVHVRRIAREKYMKHSRTSYMKNMQDEDKIKLTNGWRLIRFLDRGPDISERHGDGDSTGVSFV